jgi:hypothetical protein
VEEEDSGFWLRGTYTLDRGDLDRQFCTGTFQHAMEKDDSRFWLRGRNSFGGEELYPALVLQKHKQCTMDGSISDCSFEGTTISKRDVPSPPFCKDPYNKLAVEKTRFLLIGAS